MFCLSWLYELASRWCYWQWGSRCDQVQVTFVFGSLVPPRGLQSCITSAIQDVFPHQHPGWRSAWKCCVWNLCRGACFRVSCEYFILWCLRYRMDVLQLSVALWREMSYKNRFTWIPLRVGEPCWYICVVGRAVKTLWCFLAFVDGEEVRVSQINKDCSASELLRLLSWTNKGCFAWRGADVLHEDTLLSAGKKMDLSWPW